jgi:hypothetical protein
MLLSNPARRTISLGLLLLLAACSGPDGQFPSLERRSYETDNPIDAPAAAPAAPVALPVELTAKVDALMARHRTAQAAFAKGLGAVQSVASKAAGSSPGNESWVNAHLQLSRLDKARADSVAVVRAFDSLITEQGEGDSVYVPLLTEAQKPVADDVAAQDNEINRISRLIGE